MWRGLLWGLVLMAVGCAPASPPLPGDEVLGVFSFTAQVVELPDGSMDPAWQDCSTLNPSLLDEVPKNDFIFQGIFSRDTGTGQAWLTLNGQWREASFDGQSIVSTSTAPRQFKAYGVNEQAGPGTVTETLQVALLSRSQNAAVGNVCPGDALSGGVPVGNGVTPPGPTPTGFDALRACGVLVDVVAPDVGCSQQCVGCTLRYPLTGVRR